MEITATVVVLNAIAGWIKKYVPLQYRGLAVHGAIFVGSLAWVYYKNPALATGDLVTNAIGYLSLAIATYEVVWKRVMPLLPTA